MFIVKARCCLAKHPLSSVLMRQALLKVNGDYVVAHAR